MRAAAVLSFAGVATASALGAVNPNYWHQVLEIDLDGQEDACLDALDRANQETTPACFIPFGFFVSEDRVDRYCSDFKASCSVELYHQVKKLQEVCLFGALPYGWSHVYNRHFVHFQYLVTTFKRACKKYKISPGVKGYCNVYKKSYLSEQGLSFTQQDRNGLDDFKDEACHHECRDLLAPEAMRAITRLVPEGSDIDNDEALGLCNDDAFTITELTISTKSDVNYQQTMKRLEAAAAANDAIAKEAESVFTDDMIFSFPGSRESYYELMAQGGKFCVIGPDGLDVDDDSSDDDFSDDDISDVDFAGGDFADDYFTDIWSADSESFGTAAEDLSDIIDEIAENLGMTVDDTYELIREELEPACVQQIAYPDDNMKSAKRINEFLRSLRYPKRCVSRCLRSLSRSIGETFSGRFSGSFSGSFSGRFSRSISGSVGGSVSGRSFDSFSKFCRSDDCVKCFRPGSRRRQLDQELLEN